MKDRLKKWWSDEDNQKRVYYVAGLVVGSVATYRIQRRRYVSAINGQQIHSIWNLKHNETGEIVGKEVLYMNGGRDVFATPFEGTWDDALVEVG